MAVYIQSVVTSVLDVVDWNGGLARPRAKASESKQESGTSALA